MQLTVKQVDELTDSLEGIIEALSLALNQLMFIDTEGQEESTEVEVPFDDYDREVIKEHTGIEI